MSGGSQRIRVLQIIPALSTGGAERVVLDLIQYLDPRLFDVAIVSLFPFAGRMFENEAKHSNLKVFYLSKNAGFSPRTILELNNIVRDFRPDVIHNHLYAMHYVLPVALLNNIRVRVHTLHNPVDIKMPEWWRKMIYTASFRLFHFHPVSVSMNVRQSLHNAYGRIQSSLIYNGTDLKRIDKHQDKRLAWRSRHSIDENVTIFVNIARLHVQKNHDLLIEAFAHVVRKFPKSILLLVGSGSRRAEINHKVATLSLEKHVRLLGDRNDIADILNASDIAVSSSDWEGLAIGLIEGTAAGLPTVATAVGGIPEVVVHGCTGFLVPKGNLERLSKALLVLRANPKIARWMGEQGRQRARGLFDVREMARRYGQLYLELFERSQRGRSNVPDLAAG